jgi:transcriptional regulator with XRE-family HTH domain
MDMTPIDILNIRRRTGLSQEQFSRLMGVQQATVSYWENGQHYPREVQLEMLKQLRVQFADEAQMQVNQERVQAALKVGLIAVLGFLFGGWGRAEEDDE